MLEHDPLSRYSHQLAQQVVIPLHVAVVGGITKHSVERVIQYLAVHLCRHLEHVEELSVGFGLLA